MARLQIEFFVMAELCEHCGLDSLETDIREGIVVCTSCGVVAINRLISDEADWRNFGGDGILIYLYILFV